jgi:predicted nuclease with TOPRIM domain
MNETWEFIESIARLVGMFAIPLFSWVVFNLIQQGKQIIILEQKVNDSLNNRMTSLEKTVGEVEEKIDRIDSNIVDFKLHFSELNSNTRRVEDKIGTLISSMENK